MRRRVIPGELARVYLCCRWRQGVVRELTAKVDARNDLAHEVWSDRFVCPQIPLTQKLLVIFLDQFLDDTRVEPEDGNNLHEKIWLNLTSGLQCVEPVGALPDVPVANLPRQLTQGESLGDPLGSAICTQFAGHLLRLGLTFLELLQNVRPVPLERVLFVDVMQLPGAGNRCAEDKLRLLRVPAIHQVVVEFCDSWRNTWLRHALSSSGNRHSPIQEPL